MTEPSELVDFWGKSKSEVWPYFGFETETNELGAKLIIKKRAVCRKCGTKLAYSGGTSSLAHHLKVRHDIIFAQNNEPIKSSSAGSSKQSSIQEAFGHKTPLTQTKRQEIDTAIENLIVKGLRPLSLVEDESFIDLIKVCEPRYKVPSRGTIVNRLKKRYNELSEQVKIELKSLDYCAITHDTWTSIATQNFGGLTVHYITPDWCLKSLCLETKEIQDSHTAANLARHITTSQKEWEFPIPTAVSDNATNESKAFKILKWNRIACFGHNVNLAVKYALKDDSATDILARGRRVVQYFHKSTTAANILKEKQKISLPSELWDKKLVQDVATRWNSSYDMLERLIEQSPAVHAALNDPKTTLDGRNVYSYDDQKLIDAMLKFLKPFKDATTVMSTETVPSLPALYPTFLKLTHACEVSTDDPEPIQNMKNAAKRNLEKRYSDENNAILMASFLHPRTKHLKFVPDDERQQLHESVKKELDCVIQNYGNVEPTQEQICDVDSLEMQEPRSKIKKVACEDFMDWIDDIVKPLDNNDNDDRKEKIEREMSRYIAEPSEKTDSLVWWRKMEPIFPYLSVLARKYLCVPASSVPCERIFSITGHLVCRRRAALSPENINMLVFLNRNLNKL